MTKSNPKNERIKREYFTYLEEAKRLSAASVDSVAAAISSFEKSTGYKDFAKFHIEHARKFKRTLEEAINPNTKKPLSKATVRSRLNHLKAFFQFLSTQPGYKRRITYPDCEYFNMSANDERIATAVQDKPIPSLEQVKRAIELMPHSTDIEKRNRALFALAILTGARDDALASLKLSHIDVEMRHIHQDARDVRTKNRKTIKTTFFPVDPLYEQIVQSWVKYLKDGLEFADHDPLFPKDRVEQDENNEFKVDGLTNEHWANADRVRRIFKEAFNTAGFPYYNPHSIRNTLTQLGEKICKTPEEFKAWSQNLGHDKVLTTFQSYGDVSSHRQDEILKFFSEDITNDNKPNAESLSNEQIDLLIESLKKQKQ